MKIYAYYLEDGRIYSVRSCEGVKLTDQEIIDKINGYNEKEGREAYKLFNVPAEMEELFTFFIGEKGYKKYADMTDLDDSINELQSQVVDAYDTIYDLNHSMEYLKQEFDKLKEKLGVEDNGEN